MDLSKTIQALARDLEEDTRTLIQHEALMSKKEKLLKELKQLQKSTAPRESGKLERRPQIAQRVERKKPVHHTQTEEGRKAASERMLAYWQKVREGKEKRPS